MVKICMAPFLVAFLASAAIAEQDVHWSYSGIRGPDHWGELSEAFAACNGGKNQSPIDISDSLDADLPPLKISYLGSTIRVVNNGHTLQVDVGSGNRIEVGGERYELVQFHFHSPSEHRIRGESFPLEAHFVHQNERDELAVLALLFRTGAQHAGLATIESVAPDGIGTAPFQRAVSDLGLLVGDTSHYRYGGSLTTPPCTEGVTWLVFRATATVDPERVDRFITLIGKDARPIQPSNGRLVLH